MVFLLSCLDITGAAETRNLVRSSLVPGIQDNGSTLNISQEQLSKKREHRGNQDGHEHDLEKDLRAPAITFEPALGFLVAHMLYSSIEVEKFPEHGSSDR